MLIEPITEEIKPLRDHIADTIRTLIIEGKMVAGERLREPDLSGQLGVSRTPLREALLLLESEGFVRVLPRRGAVVSPLSVRDATEIYQVKGALEALAARMACATISPAQLYQLETINAAIERESDNHTRILELNADFHHVLSDAAKNEKLGQYIRLLRRQALRYNYIYLSTLSHLQDSVKQHRAIIEALRAGDPETTELRVREHGESACRALCAFILGSSLPSTGSHP